MNRTIKELFEQYRKNTIEWSSLERSLMKSSTREQWTADFYKTMPLFQKIYDSNKDLIAELTLKLDNLDEESSAELLEEVFATYMADEFKDGEFFIYMANRLIEYNEKAGNVDNLLRLYTMRENNLLVVGNPEGLGPAFDISDTTRVMAYLDEYESFNDSTRYRIWIAHYNYIARLTDYGVVGIGDALDAYDRIMAVANRPAVIEMDKNVKKIQNIKGFLQTAMFICIALIDKSDAKERERFHQYTTKIFERDDMKVQSLYELPVEMYACHLFNDFMEKKINIDEVFKNFVDYTTYKYRKIINKAEYDQDEVHQSINAIRYITNLARHVHDQNMVTKAVSEILNIVQSNWVKTNLKLYEKMSDVLEKACTSLISFDAIGVDKDKAIMQLVVQRDIHVFISSKVTTEITMALYREITTTDVSFFDEVKSIPSSQWKNYAYYSSMFSDIGRSIASRNAQFKSRPLFEEEKRRHELHTVYGAERMMSVKHTEKYAPVVMGHHTYYNLDNISEYYYDRTSTDLNAFTDIIALATYIARETDYFWDVEKRSRRFESVLQEIKNEKEKRFNGRVVDAILNNEALQNEIEKIVTTKREDIVFEVYHNWEKIQLSQDEESMLAECASKFAEFRKTHDEEFYAPYAKNIDYLFKNSQKESIRKQALYWKMMHKFVQGRFTEGISMSTEVESYIKKSRDRERLVEFYFSLGTAELLRENLDAALADFLTAIWVCETTPGCESTRNMCYLNIAGIFSARYNYAKAKEYFDKYDPTGVPVPELFQYECMKAYCYAKLNMVEDIRESRDRISRLMEENQEYVLYAHYVYIAIFSSVLGDEEGLEKAISDLKGVSLSSDEVKYYSEEMFMYIELLVTTGREKPAIELVDYYINLCNESKEYAGTAVRLYNIKVELLASLNGYTEILKCEEKLREAYYESCDAEAKRIETIAQNLQQEIKLRAEHEKIINNKELLEESVKKAKSDSESKSQFLSSMSHEIRTPINAIIGFNEMIMRESTEESVLEYASDINNAGKQLLGIINDILDYSKIEAGKMVIVPQNYTVKTLVNDIKNMIGPKIREKGLEFIVNCNEEIPHALLGDDLRIKQILLNLLSNAYKYTKEGSVTFNIDYKKLDEKTVTLHFDVKDTGIGLKKEQIERIANPFERFELSKNHSVEGTGLGMNIVTRLLEQMESRLVIESEFGVGSTFSFDLNQGVVEWNESSKLEANRREVLSTSCNIKPVKKGMLNAPKAKILVVDDNAVNLKVAVALLKRTNMQVTPATSGQECLELCASNEYHVILLDHMMPEMDGIETLKKLKEQGGPSATTPVVALTANVADNVDDFYSKAGFDALLTKPIDIDKMEDLISSLLPDYLVE